LKQFIAEHNRKDVIRQFDNERKFPKFLWEDRGWRVQFELSPVKEDAVSRRQEGARNVGAIHYGGGFIDLDQRIAKAINRKQRYGTIDKPLILVLNVIKDSIFCDDEMMKSALFGRSSITVELLEDGTHRTTPSRNGDGAWIKPQVGVINKRISGIWLVKGLTAFSLHETPSKVWMHPKANINVPPSKFNTPSMVFDEESMQMVQVNPEK